MAGAVNTAVILCQPEELVKSLAVLLLIETMLPAVDALYQIALILKEPSSALVGTFTYPETA